MFGNLKIKLEEISDFKKYSTPQAVTSLIGPRLRSLQHTASLSRQSHHSSSISIQNMSVITDNLGNSSKKEMSSSTTETKTVIKSIDCNKKLEIVKKSQEEELDRVKRTYEELIRKCDSDLETIKETLENQIDERNKIILDLRNALRLEKEKNGELLEFKEFSHRTDLESELEALKENYLLLEDNNKFLQSSYTSMEDSLNHERMCLESLHKESKCIKSKLETVISEKTKLSANLDIYLKKVAESDEQLLKLEEENNIRLMTIARLESKVNHYETLCTELKLNLESYESEFVRKMEESDMMVELKRKLKNYEDDSEEKKQVIKVQSQRLWDMKKTLQRELKKSIDSDSGGFNQISLAPMKTWRKQAFTDIGAPEFPQYIEHNGMDTPELVNLEYLKHVVIKFLTLRDDEAVHLTRAVSTLLRMTPEEENLIRETLEYRMSWFGLRPHISPGQLGKPTQISQ